MTSDPPRVERRPDGAAILTLMGDLEDEFFTLVLHAAAAGEGPMRRAFLRDVKELRESVDLSDLTKAIEATNTGDAVDLLVPSDADLPRVREAWIDTFNAGGKAAARDLNAALGNRKVAAIVARTSIRFDSVNPEAVRFAREKAASRVVEIVDAMRDAIRKELAKAFTEARAPRELARRLIDRDLGLNSQRVEAVRNFEADLIVKGLDDPTIARRTERYAEAQLRDRARTIARTETIEASARGQDELWDQTANAGLIDRDTAEEEFLVTPDDRLCPVCEPMDGQRVALGEQFTTGEGEKVDGPPVHPACRCAKALIP